MGVDAIMYAAIPNALSDAELLVASYEVAEAFGAGEFFIEKDRKERQQHALTRLGSREHEFIYELIPPPPAEWTVVEVNLWSRYWGPGYERGDFPLIYMLSLYLEHKYGARVYYGGDTGDSILAFDDNARAEMLAHFAKVGNRPYRHRGGQDFGGQHCAFCNQPMSQYGFGGSFAAYICLGCDERRSTRDGGRTWQQDDKDRQSRPVM